MSWTGQDRIGLGRAGHFVQHRGLPACLPGNLAIGGRNEVYHLDVLREGQDIRDNGLSLYDGVPTYYFLGPRQI